MLQLSNRRRAAAHGFTLLEIMIALAVMGILLAVGMPAMSTWSQVSKARSAVGFYAEGFALARQQAIAHNGASRIVLTPNAGNDQNDWQVDICFPTAAAACNATSGGWSTVAAAATGDPEQAAGFHSVARAATGLPKTSVLMPERLPAGASSVYFNSLGWVDTSIAQRMTALRFAPGSSYQDQLRPTAIVIGLAGTAITCDWSVEVPDSRACPP
jgi:type IV fimbrial biogenesis protein FimT